MRKILFLTPLLLLGACAQKAAEDQGTVISVPVSAPCVRGTRPAEVVSLKKKMTKEQWAALATDQREKLLVAQASDRKGYGDELYVATVGCP